jgi:hypothetical protein
MRAGQSDVVGKHSQQEEMQDQRHSLSTWRIHGSCVANDGPKAIEIKAAAHEEINKVKSWRKGNDRRLLGGLLGKRLLDFRRSINRFHLTRYAPKHQNTLVPQQSTLTHESTPKFSYFSNCAAGHLNISIRTI